jgi:hypothetical protein
MLDTGYGQPEAELHLQNRLADPNTIASLNRLLDMLPELVFGITAFKGLLQRGPTIADNISDSLDEFRPKDWDAAKTKDALTNAIGAGGQFLSFINSPEFKALLESDILKPESIKLVSKLADSLTDATKQYDPAQRLGAIGLLRVLNDPDVQRATSFLSTVLKNFGQQLAKV